VNSKINQTSHTPEAIARAMDLADLQIELLRLDMASATRDSIGALFEGREGDPTAERMQKMAQSILEFQDGMSDRQLIESLFKITPRGRVDIETTAYSIACDFHDLVDWVRMFWKKRRDLNRVLRIPHMLVPKGYAGTHAGFRPDDPDGKLHIVDANVHRAFGIRKLEPVKRHELRHSMNSVVSPEKVGWGLVNYMDAPDDERVDAMVRNLTEATMRPLKDEISAFIFGGNQSKLFLKHFVFPFSPLIGLYNFGGRPGKNLAYWERHGLGDSTTEKVRKKWKGSININRILDRSYAAVELLEQKGHTRDWAVSFLCAEDNLTADWLPLAQACPAKEGA
jgi:hypothetical protein